MLHIVGTYRLSIAAGSIQSLYKGYINVPCVLYTIGVFCLLRDIAGLIEKNERLRHIVIVLGRYAFAVYLIHWFVLRIVGDLFEFNTKSIYYRVLFPGVVYIIVVLTTWCLRKIPLIKRIVP